MRVANRCLFIKHKVPTRNLDQQVMVFTVYKFSVKIIRYSTIMYTRIASIHFIVQGLFKLSHATCWFNIVQYCWMQHVGFAVEHYVE
jgi:hypothetical protein